MNVVTLIGHVGRDPEVRSFPNGDRVAQLSLATSKYARNPTTGAREDKTDWHRIRFYGPAAGGLVDRVTKAVRKGSRISVVGELSTAIISTQSGDRVTLTYIDVRRMDGLEILDIRRNEPEGPTGNHIPDEAPLSDSALEALGPAD